MSEQFLLHVENHLMSCSWSGC